MGLFRAESPIKNKKKRGSAQLRTLVSIMDYNPNFGGIFLIVNMDRLENDQNFFNKSGYDLKLLLKALYPILNYMIISLLISKAFET